LLLIVTKTAIRCLQLAQSARKSWDYSAVPARRWLKLCAAEGIRDRVILMSFK
jgi:hypothetical protein